VTGKRGKGGRRHEEGQGEKEGEARNLFFKWIYKRKRKRGRLIVCVKRGMSPRGEKVQVKARVATEERNGRGG